MSEHGLKMRRGGSTFAFKGGRVRRSTNGVEGEVCEYRGNPRHTPIYAQLVWKGYRVTR